MKLSYVLDTYAWAEYFQGTKKGKYVEELLALGGVGTPLVVIAELADSFQREHEDFSTSFAFVRANTTILPLTITQTLNSGSMKKRLRETEKNAGIIDALIYLCAQENRAVLVSGDKHFSKIEGVLFLTENMPLQNKSTHKNR
ncbi:PIN domain-containing protein [Candidatus Woesearchaeota archaeon]|nr:PIN domain-containing protein [Candidatus Woesearchaeota archaeon]